MVLEAFSSLNDSMFLRGCLETLNINSVWPGEGGEGAASHRYITIYIWSPYVSALNLKNVLPFKMHGTHFCLVKGEKNNA